MGANIAVMRHELPTAVRLPMEEELVKEQWRLDQRL